MDDRLERERDRAERAGRDLTEPVRVTHFFSSPGRHPVAIVRALNDVEIADIVVDEEITGDGFWHVAAFAPLFLAEFTVDAVERRMERIAQEAHATYNGWQVTLTVDEEQQIRGGGASAE